jgi:dTDP-4-dehydrorhamnose 3,5-epimerase-like enzyme
MSRSENFQATENDATQLLFVVVVFHRERECERRAVCWNSPEIKLVWIISKGTTERESKISAYFFRVRASQFRRPCSVQLKFLFD